MDSFCWSCEAKKKLGAYKYVFLQQQAKQRAIQDQKNYGIFIDLEDEQYRIRPIDSDNNGFQLVEQFTKFARTDGL